MLILLTLQGSATNPDSVDVRDDGNQLVFTMQADDCSNISSAWLYYYFDNGNWSSVRMSCDKGHLTGYVDKKDNFGVLYYYVLVEYRNGTAQKSSHIHEYMNTEGQKTMQILCIAAFFIFFIIFEVVMRYPILKRRKSEKECEEEGDENEKSEERDEKEVSIMKCPNCGKLIPSNSDICPYCGISLSESKEITMGDD